MAPPQYKPPLTHLPSHRTVQAPPRTRTANPHGRARPAILPVAADSSGPFTRSSTMTPGRRTFTPAKTGWCYRQDWALDVIEVAAGDRRI